MKQTGKRGHLMRAAEETVGRWAGMLSLDVPLLLLAPEMWRRRLLLSLQRCLPMAGRTVEGEGEVGGVVPP